jgi:hypothetical protein
MILQSVKIIEVGLMADNSLIDANLITYCKLKLKWKINTDLSASHVTLSCVTSRGREFIGELNQAKRTYLIYAKFLLLIWHLAKERMTGTNGKK